MRVAALEPVVWVSVTVFLELSVAALVGEARQMLDTESGTPPSGAWNRDGQRYEVQPIRRKRLRRFVREQAADPHLGTAVVIEVRRHAKDAEQIGTRGISLALEETAQGDAVVGRYAFIGVQLHDPAGV